MHKTSQGAGSRRHSLSTVLAYALICICIAFGGNAAVADVSAATATLTGRVEATKPFQLAKVRATNADKNVLYMVYTIKGNYKAVGLLPGKYEVSVEKDGFSSDIRTINVKAGENVKLDFKMRVSGHQEFLSSSDYPFADWQRVTDYLTYDEVYPPGPDRGLMEKACMDCHLSPTYLPGHPRLTSQWMAAIKHHMTPESGALTHGGVGYPANTALMPDPMSQADQDRIANYLGAAFPPGPKRGVRYTADELPLDEATVGNAMFIEYYAPLDPVHDAGKLRRQVQDAHLDLNGNVWYTENSKISRIGMLNPRTAEFKDYPLPLPHAYPHGLTVDAGNEIWWDERDVNFLGRLNQTTGKMTHYVSDPAKTENQWYNHTPVVDSKGNIWSSHIGTNKIRKWDRATGRTKLYEFQTKHGLAYGMDVDRHDNIWVAETGGCKVAKFDQKTETFTEYSSLTLGKMPHTCEVFRVGVDLEGNAWYSVRHGLLGRVDAKTGKVTEYPVPTKNSNPYDVQADMQGNIWLSDAGMGGALIRFDPRTEKFSVFKTPQITDIARINISSEGALWYAPRTGDRAGVGVLYPDITKFKQIPSASDIPMTLMRYK